VNGIRSAREYFFWRVRRRLMQDALVAELKAADASLSHGACLSLIAEWMDGKARWEDDKAVLDFFESEGAAIDEKLGEVRKEAVKTMVSALLETLSADAKTELLKAL
jgi:hypothetical protein